MTTCRHCCGRLDRPGQFGCRRKPHPKPDKAQKIATMIEADLTGRRGFSFDGLDDEIKYEIRDKWASIIRRAMRTT